MAEKTLTMHSFGYALKKLMIKDAKIKFYDIEKKCFELLPDAEPQNASNQEVLFSLLYSSLIYTLQEDDSYKLPDISKAWISETINGKIALNANIQKAAHRDDAVVDVAEYFRVNLVPFIVSNSRCVAVDRIASLVQATECLGKKKLTSLKTKRDRASDEDFLAEVWVLAVTTHEDIIEVKNEHDEPLIYEETTDEPPTVSNQTLINQSVVYQNGESNLNINNIFGSLNISK
jgi:hypothetical protein